MMLSRKVAFIIDGYFMNKRIQSLKTFYFNGPNIREYCLKHIRGGDDLYRIFYYDTPPLEMKGTNPISGKTIDFSTTNVAKKQMALLDSIRETPNFALRLGKTSWINNEWVVNKRLMRDIFKGKIDPKGIPENAILPRVQQKLVDMKIGLDISSIALKRVATHLVIISGDSDLVPAIKLARAEGMRVCLDPLWGAISKELKEHVDYITTRAPKPAELSK